MGIQDPGRLSDREWAERYQEVAYIRKQEIEENRKQVFNQMKGLLGG